MKRNKQVATIKKLNAQIDRLGKQMLKVIRATGREIDRAEADLVDDSGNQIYDLVTDQHIANQIIQNRIIEGTNS